MKYFSGFGFSGEEQLFLRFLETGEYDIAGFSYGAQLAIKEALKDSRVQRLTLLSPAFFQDTSNAFKKAQLAMFKKNTPGYNDGFLKLCEGFTERDDEHEIARVLMRPSSEIRVENLKINSKKSKVAPNGDFQIIEELRAKKTAVKSKEMQEGKYFDTEPKNPSSTKYIIDEMGEVHTIRDYFVGGSLFQLESLLFYTWAEADFLELTRRGIEIEIFLGGQDSVMDSAQALRFFRALPVRIFWIKNGNHFLFSASEII